jgi:hypothetical protein
MRVHIVVATIAVVSCVAGSMWGRSALAADDSQPGKDGKDDVVGVVWNYTIARGKAKESGQFRVYNKKIYREDKVVGKYEQTGDQKTKITFTDWPEMNGTVNLTKTRRHPPRAYGKLKKTDGTEWDMTVQWKDG